MIITIKIPLLLYKCHAADLLTIERGDFALKIKLVPEVKETQSSIRWPENSWLFFI